MVSPTRPALVTIGQLAGKYQLSRTTIIYYEKQQLFSASTRSNSGYRLYSDADCKRLERILLFRATGMSVKDIRELLSGKPSLTAALLEQRIAALGNQIETLQAQRLTVINLLKLETNYLKRKRFDIATWTELMRQAGFNEESMLQWHKDFENEDPDGHEQFLLSLGLDGAETRRIRYG